MGLYFTYRSSCRSSQVNCGWSLTGQSRIWSIQGRRGNRDRDIFNSSVHREGQTMHPGKNRRQVAKEKWPCLLGTEDYLYLAFLVQTRTHVPYPLCPFSAQRLVRCNRLLCVWMPGQHVYTQISTGLSPWLRITTHTLKLLPWMQHWAANMFLSAGGGGCCVEAGEAAVFCSTCGSPITPHLPWLLCGYSYDNLLTYWDM